MLEQLREDVAIWVKNTAVDRTIDAHVDLKSTTAVKNRFKQLISEGGVPLTYANHQGYTDGIAFAVLSNYLRNLASMGPDYQPLKGLAVIFAKSMANGAQSEELKQTYDLLIDRARIMGSEPIPMTREKDVSRYRMERDHINLFKETRPLIQKLYEGFGIGLLPEGTVQGGRHPEGSDIEEIYGMQRVENSNLKDIFELMKKVLAKKGKKPFLLPVGLHGSFRIMQSADGGGPPMLTEIGEKSLKKTGPLGISLVRIQANMLMPYEEADIELDLGKDWGEDPDCFNSYAMRKVAAGIPAYARGYYAAIELSSIS